MSPPTQPKNKLNFSSLPHGHNNNLYLPSRQGLCDFMSLGSQFIGDINFDLLFNWGHWVRIILKMKVGTMPQPANLCSGINVLRFSLLQVSRQHLCFTEMEKGTHHFFNLSRFWFEKLRITVLKLKNPILGQAGYSGKKINGPEILWSFYKNCQSEGWCKFTGDKILKNA